MPRKSDNRCPSCGSRLQCPECSSDRLNKYGQDHSAKKQRYICRACGRHTITPRCPTCPDKRVVQRELSSSGRRCLTCGEALKFCPYCGEDMLIKKGSKSWTLRDETKVSREMYRCVLCNKITTRPTCNCDMPYMSDVAHRRAADRLSAAPSRS